MHATIFFRSDGDGSIWLNNIVEVSEINKASIINAKLAAEWLADKRFDRDVTIQMQPRRQAITGRSWELMLAIGLCSLLTGKPLPPRMTGTGRIGQDGIILDASSYPEKLWASLEAHVDLFLLPYGIFRDQIWLDSLQVIPVVSIEHAWSIVERILQ